MTSYLYMFKASGLQRYIFATQPLLEAIGASQLLIDLTEEHLARALDAAEASDHQTSVQRAAGLAILEFDDREALERFYAIWPLVVSKLAPGLEIDQWCAERRPGKLFEDLQRGWNALRHRRNVKMSPLPEIAPVVRRSTMSGEGAVGPHPKTSAEVADAASIRKIQVADDSDGSAAGVHPEDVNTDWAGHCWAKDLSQISRGENSFLAVVHADGNRIGSFLIEVARAIGESDLPDSEVANFYRQFSTRLNRATKRAVASSLKDIEAIPARGEAPIIPARPVVVGGDDVTLVLPADKAMEVTERFLRRFMEETADMLRELNAGMGDFALLEQVRRTHFTACAGVVFHKQKYPLLQGYEHAEALCSFAKNEGADDRGNTVSSLLFTRLLDSDRSDHDLRRAQNFVDSSSGIRICAGPYAVDNDGSGLISLEALRAVKAGLVREDLSRNTAREIIDHLHSDKVNAEQAFERAEVVGGSRVRRFAKTLRAAREMRDDDREFHNLSTLPDAAILEKMETQ